MKTTKALFGILGITLALVVHAQAQTFLTNGLVAYYPFNGNANDASGNGNNGQITAGTFVSDRFGNLQGAFAFPSVPTPGSVAGVLTTSLQTPGNVFSLSAWFKADPQGGGQLISFGDSQNGHDFNADRNLIFSGGKIAFLVYPGSLVVLEATNIVTYGQWHSAVATLSGAGMKLYLDGVMLTNNASVTSAQSYSGYWHMARTYGDIDDVRIYNRALSASEVRDLYLYESTPSQAGSFTNYFSTANTNEWLVSGGGSTNATPYQVGPYYGLLYISPTSTSNSNGTYVVGMTNFTGFWTADHVFYLPYNASNISLTYSNFAADDRGMLLLNGNTIVAAGIYYNGSQENPGNFVYTDGGSPQPYSSFAGTTIYGLVPGGVVTNGFVLGGFNTLRAIVNNTYQGVVGPNLPLYGTDGTGVAVSGAVSYSISQPQPTVGLIKAVKPSFSNLTLTTNYQLQVSGDLNTWTNQGPVFTATNTSMVYPQYWDVDNWGELFFRLQLAP